MIRLLRFLLTGDWHLHKWETLWESLAMDGKDCIGRVYYLKCTSCGDIKRKELY